MTWWDVWSDESISQHLLAHGSHKSSVSLRHWSNVATSCLSNKRNTCRVLTCEQLSCYVNLKFKMLFFSSKKSWPSSYWQTIFTSRINENVFSRQCWKSFFLSQQYFGCLRPSESQTPFSWSLCFIKCSSSQNTHASLIMLISARQ